MRQNEKIAFCKSVIKTESSLGIIVTSVGMVVVVLTLVGMLWGIDIGRGFSAAWHLGVEYVSMLRLLTRQPERPRPTPRLAATEQVEPIKTIKYFFSISDAPPLPPYQL